MTAFRYGFQPGCVWIAEQRGHVRGGKEQDSLSDVRLTLPHHVLELTDGRLLEVDMVVCSKLHEKRTT